MEYDALLQSKILETIREYRKGDRDAGASLLTTYGPLMSRYIALVTKGSFDITDITMCQFLTLIDKNLPAAASQVVAKFESMVLDEVVAEVHYCLLQAAMASDDIPTEFKRTLMNKIVWFVVGEPQSLLEEYEESPVLDDLWISGIGVSNGFEELSEGERYVLLLAYQDGLSTEQMMESLRSQDILINAEAIEEMKRSAREHLKLILEARGYFIR